MSDRDGKRMCVFGKSRSGKSYYTIQTIKGLSRVLVFDPKLTFKIENPNYTVIRSLRDFLTFMQAHQRGGFKVVYEPEAYREESDLHEISKIVWRLQSPYIERQGKGYKSDEKLMFVNEEAHEGCPNPPDRKLNGFGKIVKQGGQMGINVISVTQRPQDMSKFIRENVDRIACFSVSGEDAVETVSRTMMARDARPTIAELKPREFVFWDEIDGWKKCEPL